MRNALNEHVNVVVSTNAISWSNSWVSREVEQALFRSSLVLGEGWSISSTSSSITCFYLHGIVCANWCSESLTQFGDPRGGGGGALALFQDRHAIKYRVFKVHSRWNFEDFYVKHRGRINVGNQSPNFFLKTNKKQKIIMQYNMSKRPHFASSKKMEGSILFHGGFSSLRILWTPLCINVDMKGYIWGNIWSLKSFCNCCRTSCYLANVGQLCYLTH